MAKLEFHRRGRILNGDKYDNATNATIAFEEQARARFEVAEMTAESVGIGEVMIAKTKDGEYLVGSADGYEHKLWACRNFSDAIKQFAKASYALAKEE